VEKIEQEGEGNQRQNMPPTATRPAERRCGCSIWWLPALGLLPLVSQDQCTALLVPKPYEEFSRRREAREEGRRVAKRRGRRINLQSMRQSPLDGIMLT